MLDKTGGGFLRSHGMKGGGGLPSAQPMKPMPIPPDAVAQPQGGGQASAPPPQGGFLGGPQGGAPAGPPMGAPAGPMPPRGAGQAPQTGGAPDDVNDVANNALMLLHDEDAGAAFDQMIGQGPEGAGQALAELYSQVRQGYEAQGQPIDEEAAGDALAVVLGDVWEIGQASGGLKTPDDLNAAMQHGFSLIAQQYPDVAAQMQEDAQGLAGGQGAPQPQGQPQGQPMPQGQPQGY